MILHFQDVKVKDQAYLIAFGNHLKEIIRNKGLSPDDVATFANIETKQVYRAINGERSITISTLHAIAKGLEIHPKKLLDFDF